MKYDRQKSFTLIELLVVIAVIGLLASIIIVNLTGTRSKANIARGLQFSQSVHNALGAYAVGVWSFDEGSGTTANDASGYNNHGTIYGASYTTDTPNGKGYALSFDGVDDYVETGSNGFSTKIGTIIIWVKANSWGGTLWTNYRGDCGRIRLNTGTLISFFRTNSACSSATILSARAPGINQWHHIAVSYDFDNDEYALYIDGIQVKYSNSSYDDIGDSASTMQIGCMKDFDWPGNDMGAFFNGLIDEVRIYEKALETAQVEKLYYAGLDNLLAKGLIDEQEHQERLVKR
jgi:prepilin-type N-terminal cleavage/methylation domain-containing protein